LFARTLASARDDLDHHFLDEVAGPGPATMENLSAWIWQRITLLCQGVFRVTVYRDNSGDMCSYFGDEAKAT